MKEEYSSEFSNATFDAINKYCQVQFQAWKDLAELQVHFANLWQECLNAYIQRMSTAKNLTDLFAAESGLATEYSAKFSEDIRQLFETLAGTQRELIECFNKSGELYHFFPPLFNEIVNKGGNKTEKHPKRKVTVS